MNFKLQLLLLYISIASCGKVSENDFSGVILNSPNNEISLLIIDQSELNSTTTISLKETGKLNSKEQILFASKSSVSELAINWLNDKMVSIEYPNEDSIVTMKNSLLIATTEVLVIYEPFERVKIKDIVRNSHNRSESEIEIEISEKLYNCSIGLDHKESGSRNIISRRSKSDYKYFGNSVDTGYYRIFVSKHPKAYYSNYFRVNSGESIIISLE